jgi:RNA polymerase sigma factor (TIGR02999 family)
MESLIFETVYEELKGIAGRQLRRERRDHTLQATALVHEAYLRLVGQEKLAGMDETAFLAIAARVMRQVLVDYARTRGRAKRGAAAHRITLKEVHLTTQRDVDVEALDEALTRLEALDPRQSRMVEMRYFGGMTIPEVAEALTVSPETVKRDWSMARVWLSRELRAS